MQMSVINENLLTSKVPWAELQNPAPEPGLHFSAELSAAMEGGGVVILSINKDRNWRPERPRNLPRVTQPVTGHGFGHLLLEAI